MKTQLSGLKKKSLGFFFLIREIARRIRENGKNRVKLKQILDSDSIKQEVSLKKKSNAYSNAENFIGTSWDLTSEDFSKLLCGD